MPKRLLGGLSNWTMGNLMTVLTRDRAARPYLSTRKFAPALRTAVPCRGTASLTVASSPTLPYLLSSSYTPFLSAHLLFPPIRCTGSIHLTPPATLDPHPDNGPSAMSPPTPTHLSVCLPSPRAPSTGFPSVPLPHPYTAPTCTPSLHTPPLHLHAVCPSPLPACGPLA